MFKIELNTLSIIYEIMGYTNMSFFEDLSQLDVSDFSDRDICTLLSLCESFSGDDAADKFLFAIKWALTKVREVSILLPALNDFYVNHRRDEDLRCNFYEKFEEAALTDKSTDEDQLLFQLYDLAKRTQVEVKPYAKINLLGQNIQTGVEIQFTSSTKISIYKLVGDWVAYCNLFGYDFLSILDIISYEDKIYFLEHIHGFIQENPSELLKLSAKMGRLDVMEVILAMDSKNKPNSYDVDKAVVAAVLAEQWDVVKFMLSITADNKPNSGVVGDVLIVTSQRELWDIVMLILAMTGDNKPNCSTLSIALADAARLVCWDIVKQILAREGEDKPGDYGINIALMAAAGDGQLDVVRLILALADESTPEAWAMNTALSVATMSGHYEIVKRLLTTMLKNNPGKDAMDHSLRVASFKDEWNIVELILRHLRDIELYSDTIDLIFERAVARNQLSTLQLILTTVTENKLKVSTVDFALNKAAEESKWGVVQFLLNLTGNYEPNSDRIKDVLQMAAEAGQNQILSANFKMSSIGRSTSLWFQLDERDSESESTPNAIRY